MEYGYVYGAIGFTMGTHTSHHLASFRTRLFLGGMLWSAFILFWIWFVGQDSINNLRLSDLSGSPIAIATFLSVSVFAVVFLLPGIVITFTAGYLFGLVKGVIFVVIATTLGATLAFYLGRRIFNESLLKFLHGRHPLLFSLNDGMRHQGGVIVFLTRLIPFFPFKLSNYYFGAADYRMPGFVVATFFGVIPITTLNVNFGMMVSHLSGSAGSAESALPFWLIVSGGLSLACLIAIISHIAWRSLFVLKHKADNPDSNSEDHKHV